MEAGRRRGWRLAARAGRAADGNRQAAAERSRPLAQVLFQFRCLEQRHLLEGRHPLPDDGFVLGRLGGFDVASSVARRVTLSYCTLLVTTDVAIVGSTQVSGLTEALSSALMLEQCVETGHLALDDRIQQRALSAPDATITVRHALTHRSGDGGFKYDPVRYAALTGVAGSWRSWRLVKGRPAPSHDSC
jgi:hypothetical protein